MEDLKNKTKNYLFAGYGVFLVLFLIVGLTTTGCGDNIQKTDGRKPAVKKGVDQNGYVKPSNKNQGNEREEIIDDSLISVSNKPINTVASGDALPSPNNPNGNNQNPNGNPDGNPDNTTPQINPETVNGGDQVVSGPPVNNGPSANETVMLSFNFDAAAMTSMQSLSLLGYDTTDSMRNIGSYTKEQVVSGNSLPLATVQAINDPQYTSRYFLTIPSGNAIQGIQCFAVRVTSETGTITPPSEKVCF